MEHLLAPPGTGIIDIEYICEEQYDGQDFLTYDKRKQWSEEDFCHKPRRQVEAFLQTWMYFGTLQSVFRLAGITVTTSDFVREIKSDEKFITTTSLPEVIQAWMNKEGMSDGDNNSLAPLHEPGLVDKAAKKRRGEAIHAILLRLSNFVTTYCNTEGENRLLSDGMPISPKLGLSFMAIGMPLMHVATKIYGYSLYQPPWGSSPFLNDRLKQSGWCMANVPLWKDPFALDCDYYFGSFTSPKAQLDHAACTGLACNAKVINPAHYATKHDLRSCSGDCESIVAPANLSEIVRQGKIPIVRWHDGELTCTEYDPTTRTRYVAISHIWSDGLGNESANALPQCQLTRLQGYVTGLYVKRHITVAQRYSSTFHHGKTLSKGSAQWWDGETWEDAIPPLPESEIQVGFWMDTLCVPLQPDLRKEAIRSMKDIYVQAHRVVVLEASILKVSIDAEPVTKLVALYSSNWCNRLWTFQEGVLARSLLFQFNGGAQSAHEMDDDYQRLTRHSIKHFYSAVFDRCARLFRDAMEVYVIFEGAGESATLGLYHMFAGNMGTRSTSKFEDEAICFATLLQLDPSPLLDGPPDRRMEIFYEMVARFDVRIIFNDFPRLKTQGYQWAPKSLLSRSGDLAPGTLERMNVHYLPPANLEPGGGLLVTLPGARVDIKTTGLHLGREFYFVPRKYPDLWFDIRLLPDADGQTPAWTSKDSYVLVSAEEFKASSPSGYAVLGIVKLDEDDCITVQPVGRAIVSFPDQAPLKAVKTLYNTYLRGEKRFTGEDEGFHGKYPVYGTRLKESQKWRIL